MDQPVCAGARLAIYHALTPPSATRTRRRTTSTTTCRECTPTSSVLTSGSRRDPRRGAANLYTTCIPTARRDGPCASAHTGCVLSAITTLGRRSGEDGTVVYTQYKRRNRSTLISHASQICAVHEATCQPRILLSPWRRNQRGQPCPSPPTMPSCATD